MGGLDASASMRVALCETERASTPHHTMPLSWATCIRVGRRPITKGVKCVDREVSGRSRAYEARCRCMVCGTERSPGKALI